MSEQKYFIFCEVDTYFVLILFNSQAPETPWAPDVRCARSDTNGQAVVRSLQNFHERFRRYFKPQINNFIRQKLFSTLKKI